MSVFRICDLRVHKSIDSYGVEHVQILPCASVVNHPALLTAAGLGIINDQ